MLGAPGRSVARVQFVAETRSGSPIADALVQWTPIGRDAMVRGASTTTDEKGRLSADWLLGSDASEEQGLRVTVASWGGASKQVTLRARAIPSEIADLRFREATLTVKLGRDSTVEVIARDPFGNEFAPARVDLAVADSTVALLSPAGRVLSRRRGHTRGVASAAGHADSIELHVGQTVARIVVDSTALLIESLGASREIPVRVLDDLGQVVSDTALSVVVDDSESVRVEAADSGGLRVTSVSNGTARVRIGVGDVVAVVPVVVAQRPVAVEAPEVIAFDALSDSAALAPVVRDGAGSVIAHPDLEFASTDTSIVTVGSTGQVVSRTNGSAFVVARTANGIMDSTRVVVAQRPVGVGANEPQLSLRAIGARRHSGLRLVDRRGVAVASEMPAYSTGDPTIVSVEADGVLTARKNGETRVVARWNGDSAAVLVSVKQVPRSVVTDADSVLLTALGDTLTISAVVYDSLGSVIADASPIAASTDSAVRAQGLRIVAIRPGTAWIGVSAEDAVTRVFARVQQRAADIRVDVDSLAVLVLDEGTAYPIVCDVLDRNGFTIGAAAVTVESTVAGNRGACGDASPATSGLDTLVFTVDSVRVRRTVAVALRPRVVDAPALVPVDSFAKGAGQWAPTVFARADGIVELYHAAYARDTLSGRTHSNLNRLRSTDGGLTFVNDGVALERSADDCQPDGWGIENVAIMPRADSSGYRMLYASGSYCTGWSVKSAVSPDGRSWTKEAGVRIGDPTGAAGAAFSAGEGISVLRDSTGTWRLWAGVYVPDEGWGIEEWRSSDQLSWSRHRRVFTPRANPIGELEAIYSPSIQLIAPSLWRMYFSADRRGTPNGQSRVYSAVSRDLLAWTYEGVVVEDPATHFWYATARGDRLFFVAQPVGREADFAPRLSSVTLAQP